MVNIFRRKVVRITGFSSWGLEKIKKHLEEANLPLPEFKIEGHNFKVILHGKSSDYVPDLVENLREIYTFIKARKKVTTKEIVSEFRIDDRTAQRRLTDLVEKSIIEKIGKSGPGVYYKLSDNKKKE